MLDTWHLTEEETQKTGNQQMIQKTQEARQQGYEVFAIGDPKQGKIIAVLAQPKQGQSGQSGGGGGGGQSGQSTLPRVLSEGDYTSQ